MKKKLILCGISLLMMIGFTSKTSYAQDFQITSTQLKQTNILFNKLESLEKRDSINNLIIHDLDSLSRVLNKEITVQKALIKEQESYIKGYSEDYEDLLSKYAKEEKQKHTIIGLAAGSGILNVCLIIAVILL